MLKVSVLLIFGTVQVLLSSSLTLVNGALFSVGDKLDLYLVKYLERLAASTLASSLS